MRTAHPYQRLIEACEGANLETVKQLLEEGIDPNFDIKSPINALSSAIQVGHKEIVNVLLKHGAIVKPLVLQKAIEKERAYLEILVPNFRDCTQETLLMAVLQAAIHRGDETLAKHAIDQGAKPKALPFYAIKNLDNATILRYLLDNGFDFYANANRMVSQWMGSAATDQTTRSAKVNLVAFIAEYYLEKPNAIEILSKRILDTTRLFGLGLNRNDFKMMKFAIVLGFDKSEALNAALYRYYTATKMTWFEALDYEIIAYLLALDIAFKKVNIANAVRFHYQELLEKLQDEPDLVYAYEVAYTKEDHDLCDYFVQRGVSQKAQCFVKMKVASLKGNLDTLRKAIGEGAKVEDLDKSLMVEVLKRNHVKILQYVNDLGFGFDASFNAYLNDALNRHDAYESVSYLIEQGLDIRYVKEIPPSYKERYPLLFDMWERRSRDIFDYTCLLAQEVYPKLEGEKRDTVLKYLAELSTLPYVLKKSKQMATNNTKEDR